MDDEAALIGRTIAGRYIIERCIGRGGMAAVFAARQDGTPHEVAIKVMKRELMKDATVVKRFRREAKAAAMLDHANTVRVLDYGVDGENAYIAMELAKGKDLFQALAEERPMTQTRAVLIVAQVGAALSAAHAQGIVHRDLKPENVMLVPSPEALGGELVKVLDFGIAKILDTPGEAQQAPGEPPRRSETSTNLTRVGTVVGTPAYMSPEQCRGGELDGRSDVYSCGVLLYQLVTGQLPFLGETPLHTAMRHIHAPPRPPGELRADLDKGLERVILRALGKWPAERQQSAQQLREELLAVLDGLPDRERVLGARSEARPSPRVIQRQPTEHQVAMRLGGGLGQLVSPSTKSAPPAPQAPARDDSDDALERSETPAVRPVERKPVPQAPQQAPQQSQPQSPQRPSPQASPEWPDDDEERTRLRPPAADGPPASAARAPPPPDDDDDDGPRTALMTSDKADRALAGAGIVRMAGAIPGARETVRLGSPAPVTAPLRPARKDITAAAFARTADAAAIAAAMRDAESHGGGGLAPGIASAAVAAEAAYLSVKSTMRIPFDEQSSSGGLVPGVAPGIIAPPLAPPPPRPEAQRSEAQRAEAQRAEAERTAGGSRVGPGQLPIPPAGPGIRGSLEQLPGTTVLVVGVALGVVFSAVVILFIVYLARG